MLAEEFEVRAAVGINEENILTVVAALNNVVRLTRNDDSGHARHADNIPHAARKVNKRVTVPSFPRMWAWIARSSLPPIPHHCRARRASSA